VVKVIRHGDARMQTEVEDSRDAIVEVIKGCIVSNAYFPRQEVNPYLIESE
jgi:hypothetical protein